MVDVAGWPMIWHILKRIASAASIQQTVLATTNQPEDSVMESVASEAGAAFFQGAELDVLDRFYQAAKRFDAEIIVHVGGDCPFADPAMIDHSVGLMLGDETLDLVTNILPQTYPSGIDLDVVSRHALETAWREANLTTERNHVFQYIYGRSEQFKIQNLRSERDLVHLRWTLDYPEDLDLVRAIYEELYSPDRIFHMEDILLLLERRPELTEINGHLHSPVSGQPAFWDSEGILADMRADLGRLITSATTADEQGTLNDAARDYGAAIRIATRLRERVIALLNQSKSKP
jgi:spore coat polysaccharide biosynthesis protein SpsF